MYVCDNYVIINMFFAQFIKSTTIYQFNKIYIVINILGNLDI